MAKTAKHGIELAQRSRAAVLNALGVVEKRGTLISELLANEFEANPIRFMELAAKLMPKDHTGEIDHNHDHRHSNEPISESSEWLAETIGESEDSSTAESRTH